MINRRQLAIFVFFLILINSLIKQVSSKDFWSYLTKNDEDWKGRWFPNSPGTKDSNLVLPFHSNLYDAHHGVVMGVSNADCDDGKSNLSVDWDLNPVNYTCLERFKFGGRSDVRPLFSSDHIPEEYSAPHACMNEEIFYDKIIPTFGTHRPLWPKYGEYEFLPRQRWLHNLEHGSIAMLYHPCADLNEVESLRKLVKSCLYRHIITPYNLLSPERPLALVSWGFRLEMSKVAPEIVVDFIRKHALNGPEQLSDDGQYELGLISHAEIVSDINDTSLCQNFRRPFIE